MDESVLDSAIETKLIATGASRRVPAAYDATIAEVVLNRQLGREYAKKIFQVPYALPVMLPMQLDDLLKSMYTEAGIAPGQLSDLDTRVRPYLEVIAVQRRVNPREVKRFINSYTLQTLIRPGLKPEAVLALQTIAFRPDWQPWYEAISARPNEFKTAIKKYRDDAEEFYDFTDAHYGKEVQLLSGKKEIDCIGAEDDFRSISHADLKFTNDIRIFLSSDLMTTLLKQPDLDPYVSSLQSAAERPLRLKPAEVVSNAESIRARYSEYEHRVATTIGGLGYEVSGYERRLGGGFAVRFDLIIRKPGGSRSVFGEIKLSNRPLLPLSIVYELIGMSSRSPSPVLLISDVGLAEQAQLAVAESERLTAVQWRDESDTPQLAATLERLFASEGSLE